MALTKAIAANAKNFLAISGSTFPKIYEKLNSKNKILMEAELNRVISTHSISKNVYEIFCKILKK